MMLLELVFDRQARFGHAEMASLESTTGLHSRGSLNDLAHRTAAEEAAAN